MITLLIRTLIVLAFGSPFLIPLSSPPRIITVRGPVYAGNIGTTLVHEHVLVDFIGADKTGFDRWDRNAVVNRVAPYLAAAKAKGVKTVVECTPAFLGRDVRLLKMLADKTGLNLITNTGYYGAVGNKYLPPWALSESAEQLSRRWIDDFEYGIDGTNIRPGFIKISVDARPDSLSELHRKLVSAAALAHLNTGMTIYCHTGPGKTALEEITILRQAGVAPEALVWVHAQVEQDEALMISIARQGTWVSLDGITGDFERYASLLDKFRKENLLHRVLISHDAGYYRPGEPDGGKFTGYTAIFDQLLPLLQQRGFSRKDIRQLLIKNPAEALAIRIRKFDN